MSVDLAVRNVRERIEENPYPGRGVVLGRSGDGAWVQVYWIMGRSDNSRNRIFVCEDGVVRTEAADPSKVEDPSLIIYNAMRASGHRFVVSNGVQTDAIWAALEAGESFADSLSQWHHEPDAPNFTPRISAVMTSMRRCSGCRSSRRVPLAMWHQSAISFALMR